MIFLAIPYQETGAPPQMFRDREKAEKWMRGQSAYGGSIYEFEQIDFAQDFRLIHQYTNNPQDLEHIR